MGRQGGSRAIVRFVVVVVVVIIVVAAWYSLRYGSHEIEPACLAFIELGKQANRDGQTNGRTMKWAGRTKEETIRTIHAEESIEQNPNNRRQLMKKKREYNVSTAAELTQCRSCRRRTACPHSLYAFLHFFAYDVQYMHAYSCQQLG